eukprot:gene15802-17395_t
MFIYLFNIAVIFLFIAFEASLSNSVKIFRSNCRRDGLFKVTDRNSILSGASSANVVSATYKATPRECVRECLKILQCRSINFKEQSSTTSESNCQLLDIDKTNTSVVVKNTAEFSGWKHYEPVEMHTTPQCRFVQCAAGFQCNDTCSHPGYSCVDIDECLSSPCVHGTCNNLLNMYTCNCDSPYDGTRCDNLNECLSNPCVHGTCTDLNAAYSCQCNSMYDGTNCENLNECLSSPCVHGTCNDLNGAYSCTCPSTHYGTRCENAAPAASCGSSVSAPIGTFKSPGYPSTYSNSINCYVTITVASYYRVRLTMHAFTTESCCDKLEIRNGGSSTSTLLATLSGSPTLTSYTTTSNQMYLYFRTDGSVVNTGIAAIFLFIAFEASLSNSVKIFRSNCRRDGLFKVTDRNSILSGASSANVVSATYKATPRECVRECLKILQCRSINFKEQSSTTSVSNCQLLDIDKTNSSVVVKNTAEFSGWKHYEPVETQTTPQCRLVQCAAELECKETCSQPGYNCVAVDICGSSVSAPSGAFASPGYPLSYKNDIICNLIITVKYGYRVRLTMHDFKTEKKYDNLKIRNGGSSSSALLATLSGSPNLTSYTTTLNQMYLHFQTDGSVVNTGFNVSWSTV